MNLYSLLEPAFLVLIGVFSAYHVIKTLMPRSLQRARAMVARWLRGNAAAARRDDLADQARDGSPSAACGAGCSECNGCGFSAHTAAPLIPNEQSPR